MAAPRCSIVIPAYNEEKRIGNLLSSLNDPDTEFIFVCDGTDKTADLIDQFSLEHGNMCIRCLRFPVRLGKGGGVHKGFEAASAPLVGFMDADNSTEYAEMIRLLSYMGTSDGVIGSRHLPSSSVAIHQSLSRRLQSRVFNLLIRILFGLSYYDTQCGAKIFRKDALDQVLNSLHARGFEFDVELLWRLRQKGFTILEVPTIWNDTGDSRLKSSDAFSMFITLVRLRAGI